MLSPQSTLKRRVNILLVENEEEDIKLIHQAFLKSKHLLKFYFVKSGQECLDVLNQKGDYAQAPRPDLILLDINMPGMSGDEVLKEIKSDLNFRRIPVAMLTSSASEEEICNSYDFGANCYIQKPNEINEINKTVDSILDFWFSTVTLCPK